MSTLFASGGLQVPVPQVQNQHQPWYRKLLQHHQSATWWAPSCSPSSPQQLQLQLQQTYRVLKEKQKNCKQDWWKNREGRFASLQQMSPPASSAAAQDLSHSSFSNDEDFMWVQASQQRQEPGSVNPTLWSQQQQHDTSLSSTLARELLPHQYQPTEDGMGVWDTSQAQWCERELQNLETLRQQEAMARAAQAVKLHAELEQLIHLREKVKSRLLEMAQEHTQQVAPPQIRDALRAKEPVQQNLHHVAFASPYLESYPHLSPSHLQQFEGYRVEHEMPDASFRLASPWNYRQQLLQQYEQLLRRNNGSNIFDCPREDFHQLHASVSSAFAGRSPFIYHRQSEGHRPGLQGRGDSHEKAKQQTPKQDMKQQLPWRNKDKIRPLPKSAVKPHHSSPRTSSVPEVIERKEANVRPRLLTDVDKMSDHVVEQNKDVSIQSYDVYHSQTEERNHNDDLESQKENSIGKSDQQDVINKNRREGVVQSDGSVIQEGSSNEGDLQRVLLVLSKDRKKKSEEDSLQAESDVLETTASSSAPLTLQESLTEESELSTHSPAPQESRKASDDSSQSKRSDRRGNKKRKERKNAAPPQDTHTDAQTEPPGNAEVKVLAAPKEQRPRNKYSSRRQQAKIGASRPASHEGDQPVHARPEVKEAGVPSELKMTHAQSHRQKKRLQPYPSQRDSRDKRHRRESQDEPFHQRRQWERWPGHQRYYYKFAAAGRWRERRTESWRKSEGSCLHQNTPKTPGPQLGKNAERQGNKGEISDGPPGQEVKESKKTRKDDKHPSTPLQQVQFNDQQQERSIDDTGRPDGDLQCWVTDKAGKDDEQPQQRQTEDTTAVIAGSAFEQRTGSDTSESIAKASNIKSAHAEGKEVDTDLTHDSVTSACKTPASGAPDSADAAATDSCQRIEPENVSADSPSAKTKDQHTSDAFTSNVGLVDITKDRGLLDTKETGVQTHKTSGDSCEPATPGRMESDALISVWRHDEVRTSEDMLAPESIEVMALVSPTPQHKIESSFVKQIVFEFHPQDVQADDESPTDAGAMSRKGSAEMSVSSSDRKDEECGQNEGERSVEDAIQGCEKTPELKEIC